MRMVKMIEMAWDNLRKRRLRTALTTLGIIIGVATIIGLSSLGEGFRMDVRQRLEQGFELDVLIVFPGSFTSGFRQPFQPSDVANIKTVEHTVLVTPLITLPTSKINKTETNQKLGAYTVGAVNFTELQEMFPQRFRLQSGGHFPNSTETHGIVLGYKSATLNDVLVASVGDNVTITLEVPIDLPFFKFTFVYNQTYTVTGVLEKGGTGGITNFDYWAFIPLTATSEIQGVGDNYQIILVKVSDPKYSEQVSRNIERKFSSYSISVFVPSSLMRQVDNILSVIQVFLLAIASISMLVAGVGIMNIMTVSVMERTREIGILKAIGAKSSTVLLMFLSETMLVGLIGSLAGIFTGYELSYALSYALSALLKSNRQSSGNINLGINNIQITPMFSPEWAIIAFIFAMIVCLFFGLYPARKAAKLDPVQALRYE